MIAVPSPFRPCPVMLWSMVLFGALTLAGCVDPAAPIRHDNAQRRYAHRGPYDPLWGRSIVAGAIAALIPLAISRRRRRGYASIVCLAAAAACAASWAQSRRGYGHLAVRSYVDGGTEIENCLDGIYWGDGGLSVQRQRWRDVSPRMLAARREEPNPMLQRLSANYHAYPFGQDPALSRSPAPLWLRCGFQLAVRRSAGPDGSAGPWIWSITAPHWFLLSVLTIAPALWVRRTWRTWRRRRAGRCVRCGYDLRAGPEPGAAGGPLLERCPECGTATGPRAKTPARAEVPADSAKTGPVNN